VRGLGVTAGQGYLLAPPTRTVITERLDMDALADADRFRRAWVGDRDSITTSA
jgi:EAL domain-containing protein (putative c-di-GMP-specific phosphodiesterase class I)